MHRHSHQRGASPGVRRHGLRPVRRSDGDGPPEDPGLRHQPCGGPGGRSRQASDAPADLRDPHGSGYADRIYLRRSGSAAGLSGAVRSGHGHRRPEVLPELFQNGRGPGSHRHRAEGGGHLLVRPLPPHHLLHPHRQRRAGGSRRSGRLCGIPRLPGGGLRGEGRDPARHPDGYRHAGGKNPEKAGCAPGSGRIRGDQRLLRPHQGGHGRSGRGLAPDVQERNPQPPHGDRTLRRRGHLRGRRHPGPAVRPELRLSGHARHRRGGPHGAPVRDPARQAPPAEAHHHRRGGLFLLRQPDRPVHGPGP